MSQKVSTFRKNKQKNQNKAAQASVQVFAIKHGF